MGGDENTDMDIDSYIDRLDITKFDYRNVFCNCANKYVNHKELAYKFFDIDDDSETNMEVNKDKCNIVTIGNNGDNYSSSFALCLLENMNFKGLTEIC